MKPSKTVVAAITQGILGTVEGSQDHHPHTFCTQGPTEDPITSTFAGTAPT